jgi:hypothetical protein
VQPRPGGHRGEAADIGLSGDRSVGLLGVLKPDARRYESC